MAPERAPEPDLAERVSRLERQNRLFWRVLLLLPVLALGSMGTASLIAAVSPGVVEGSHFVLKDKRGTMRGELKVDRDGNGNLVLYGVDGRIVAELPMRATAFPLQR